jgi:hypothetical protein
MTKLFIFLCLFFVVDVQAQEELKRPSPSQCSLDTMPRIFNKAEFPPKFNGSFLKFLEKNLWYPDTSQDKGIPGIVVVEFIVHKNGTLDNFKLSEDSPQKNKWLVNESIRVLKLSSGRWLPAIQNYVMVECYHRQQINFVLANE